MDYTFISTLDTRHLDAEQAKSRARIMDKWLRVLKELVPASRRDNRFCRFGISSVWRYRAVSFTSYRRHKTLEVRLHSGTTDFTKILQWVRLLEVLMQMPKAPKKGKTCLQALLDLPLTQTDVHYWVNRHKTLNPEQYVETTTRIEQE